MPGNTPKPPLTREEELALFDQTHKRELLEARIDGADKIYTNVDDLACHGGSISSILRSIASHKRTLKAQLKQLEEE